jgi:Ca2+-binding EF-hand superfamily protein
MADQNLNQQVELIFARYDKDNSNTIEISELREYFKDIGMRLSFKELGDVIKCIDINGDGRANRQEIYLGLSQAFGSIASK